MRPRPRPPDPHDVCARRARLQSSEVEETLKRIQSHRGVEGVLIINNDGMTLKSTLDAEQTEQHAALISQVISVLRLPPPILCARHTTACVTARPALVCAPACVCSVSRSGAGRVCGRRCAVGVTASVL